MKNVIHCETSIHQENQRNGGENGIIITGQIQNLMILMKNKLRLKMYHGSFICTVKYKVIIIMISILIAPLSVKSLIDIFKDSYISLIFLIISKGLK